VKPALFISDLHLCAERPAVNEAFFGFLAGQARNAGALYILGDLFEYWAGDDDLDDPVHAAVAAGLRRLSGSGVPVSVIPGNRDFLLGARFEQATGARLLGDCALLDLFGTATLIMHGDTLCTDDTRYQAYRAAVRQPWLQKLYFALPRRMRQRIVGGIRNHSQQTTATKRPEIMDVNAEAVAQALRRHGYPRLIHGHTHRPACHRHQVDGHACERWVLDAWYEGGDFLAVGPEGIERRRVGA
jgi:UDP-2,3-diacylglucosamine hydrolase